MSLSAAVRNQWVVFEAWLAVPRGAAEIRRSELLRTLQDDFVKNKRMTPESIHPMLQQDYEGNKTRLTRHLDEELVLLARLEWERRLTQTGLKAEDWVDMTPAERHSVERLLGDLEDDEFTIIESTEGLASTSMANAQPPITQAQPISHGPPYSFVSPQAFGEEEDDGGDEDTDEDGRPFTLFPVETWTRDDSTDRLNDTHRVAAAFTRWATEESPGLSLPQSAHTQRDTTRAPAAHVPTAPHDMARKAAQPMVHPQLSNSNSTASTSSAQSVRPQPQVNQSTTHTMSHTSPAAEVAPDTRSGKPRAPAPRYVGPILHDPHDTKSEEAEFESFKVETRVKKIWEFHYAAAELDARLARTLCDRSLGKVEVRRHIAEHERAVETLRLVKEDERKMIVELERSKRVAEINRRSALLNPDQDQRQLWEAMVGSQAPQVDQRGGQRSAERKPTVESTSNAALDLLGSFSVLQNQNEKIRVSEEREERHHRQNSEGQAATTSRTTLDQTPGFRPQRSQEGQPQKMASKTHQKQPSRSSDKPKDPFASFPPSLNPATEWKTDIREAATIPVRQRRESEAMRKSGASGSNDPGNARAPGGGEAKRPTQSTAAASASTSRTTSDQSSSSASHAAPQIWTPAGVDAHASGASKRSAKAATGSVPRVQPPQDQMAWTAVDWLQAGREEQRDPIETKQSRGAKAKISTIQLPPVTSPILDAAGPVAGRLRRASDPPSPSPKIFAVQQQKSSPATTETARPKPASILKKQGHARTPRSVTVEEVPDEDDSWSMGGAETGWTSRKNAGDHPADANTIIEPKPSMPSASFAHIFQYAADEPTADAGGSKARKKSPPSDWDQESTTDSGGGLSQRNVPLPSEENNKAKHVRWTPSVANDSPSSTPVSLDDEQNILSTLGAFGWGSATGEDAGPAAAPLPAQTAQTRTRAPSLVQPVEPSAAPAASEIWQPGKQKRNEKKGKGKGKAKAKAAGPGAGAGAGGQQANEGSQDDLEWFAREAIESLKQQRSKAASAV